VETNGKVITVAMFTLTRSGGRMTITSVFSLPQAHVPESCEYVE